MDTRSGNRLAPDGTRDARTVRLRPRLLPDPAATVRCPRVGRPARLRAGRDAIPQKYKELIGLAVAAHIKCRYCIYFHEQAARAQGASDEELREACFMGGMTVQFSNALTGMRYDLDVFKAEVDRAVEYMTRAARAINQPSKRSISGRVVSAKRWTAARCCRSFPQSDTEQFSESWRRRAAMSHQAGRS